jgi:hypothetical protein
MKPTCDQVRDAARLNELDRRIRAFIDGCNGLAPPPKKGDRQDPIARLIYVMLGQPVVGPSRSPDNHSAVRGGRRA